MSELNKLKVVDFTAGRLSSEDINTNIPFTDNFEKTRTIQQANAVMAAYVNRNYIDMDNKADKDEIPTKTSELTNDGDDGVNPFITSGDIPSKTSDLTNDGEDGEHPFITNQVNDLVNYTDTTTLNGALGDINGDITTINTNIANIKSAIDYKTTDYMGEVVVESIRSKNMFDKNAVAKGYRISSSGTLSEASDYFSSDFIEIKPSTTYTIQKDAHAQYSSYAYYSEGRIFIERNFYGGVGVTITTPANAKYIRLADGLTTLGTVQLEEGSTATTYKPYQNLNNKTTYVNDEVVIGSWYNGKPLYRKVFNFTYPTGSTTLSVNANISNVEDIKKIISTIYKNGKDYEAPWYWSSSDNLRVFFRTGTPNTIEVRTVSATSNNYTITVILEYTKTTD